MIPASIAALWWLTLVGVVVTADGWLWFGGSPQLRKAGSDQNGKILPMQYGPQYSYRPMEGAPWAQQYTYDGPPVPPMTVALPVAVPITQQVGPGGAMLKQVHQPVQLVPCLCPISRDEPQSQQGQQTFPQPQPQQQQVQTQ